MKPKVKASPKYKRCNVAISVKEDAKLMERFVQLHPGVLHHEFDDSTSLHDAKPLLMACWLRSRGIQWPTMRQLEEAYEGTQVFLKEATNSSKARKPKKSRRQK